MVVLKFLQNCHKDSVPFMSITSYSEKTNEIVSKLSQLKGKAYGRFTNYYEWYAPRRKETEQWLYDGFIEKGGIPKITNPIYFTLGNSEYLQSCYGEDVKIYQIKLDDVLEKEISFTLSDSVSIHVSGEEKRVLTKKDLVTYVESKGTALLDYITHLDKNHKYIEAQIWNNSYFTQLA